ncbi:type VI secretion system lipoprotein TssJ [Pseudomonas sp. R5(2019)]|uniref:type VI secretion system lipoprotein TssJ n=1 Tax=Pseudomonas sp. R5(2019) TaxID=2697566 RepID=UPI001411D6AF|nr:type VI secretion system lipoprotein TssJ [Pseudomonas sp. R5(2019)]NBA94148.1 type VI secretion system lipoprotein TssJ [Pseudomonas sp. R5(2019)]
MKQAITLLLASVLLAGCSTVGNVFKKTGQILIDPSTQVGNAEDQVTQIALSLYAGNDVNPNPVTDVIATVTHGDSEGSEPNEDGPFAVNLNSATKGELIHSLQTLLDHLQEDTAISVPLLAPVGYLDAAQPPFPLVLDDSEAAANLALGQYLTGVSLDTAPDLTLATPNSATPIAFRILQLKDDTLLENADPNLLRIAPKKALGSTYVSSDDYILVPGQFKHIDFGSLDEKTRYIAVVADFHAPNALRSQDVFRLEPRGRKYALLVTLQNTRVAIIDESFRPSQTARRAPTQARTTP